jgi:hypothetical protein
MPDFIVRALKATRESKHVEFKESFDPSSAGEWCELIKDIVAIANSGGGIIVFGLDSCGQPSAGSIDAVPRVDPADVANKIGRYTGPVDLEFEIRQLRKDRRSLVALVIQGVVCPLVFQKPGTYEVEPGKQRTAFGAGTLYFRHGSKSEPGNTEDLRIVLDRYIERVRKAWISGVRKVVHAPSGSRMLTAAPAGGKASNAVVASTVRAVNDPTAIPVVLTRDSTKATGHFYHEGISEGIFEEINNVVEANRVLARGQQRFFLGQPVYYRVYAERQHVTADERDFLLLFNSSALEFYSPGIFWMLGLPSSLAAQVLLKLYLQPKSPHIHYLMRLSALLGSQFCSWFFSKWQRKWGRHAQPPSFYWTFKDTVAKLETADGRMVAARTSINAQVEIPGAPPSSVRELLDRPDRAAFLLSKACMCVFEGDSSVRSVARDLDYLAYGLELSKRSSSLSEALKQAIGDRLPGDPEQ